MSKHWHRCTIAFPTCGQGDIPDWGRKAQEWWNQFGRYDESYNYYTELIKEDKKRGCFRPFKLTKKNQTM